ncbi:MAG: HlyD family secretion protein [Gemmataceae bacterium]
MNKRLLRIAWWTSVVVALVGAGFFGGRWLLFRFDHSITKDAFVDSHLINVAPQVAGAIVAIYVQEQESIQSGQLLARIDPTPYQREVNLAAAKLAVAEAALAKSEADLKLLGEEVPRQIAMAERRLDIRRDEESKAVAYLELTKRDVEQGLAAAARAVDAARANLVLAQEDYQRYAALFKEQSVTERKFQEATRTLRTAEAEVHIAVARLGQAEAARQQIAMAEQQLRSARHAGAEAEQAVELARLGDWQIEVARRLVTERRQAVGEARRALELAQTNLDYTRVTAPYDGIIAKKWRHLGDYARAGEPIFSMYNPELKYVTVYLEETLLEGVHPGNPVRLDVDAFSQPFRGRVLWIGSATDAKFSLIPRDISAGEFTYVVQRVPTRIWIERDDRWPLLKPGLSVTATIAHGPGDPVWAAETLRQEAAIAGVKQAPRKEE